MKINNTIKIELIKSKSIYHVIAFLYLILGISGNISYLIETNKYSNYFAFLSSFNHDFLYNYFFLSVIHFSIDFKTSGIGRFYLEGNKKNGWIILKTSWLFIVGFILYLITIIVSFVIFEYHNHITIHIDNVLLQNIFIFPLLLFYVIIFSCIIVVLVRNTIISLLVILFYPLIESFIAILFGMLGLSPTTNFIYFYFPFANLMEIAKNTQLIKSIINPSLIVLISYLSLFIFFIFYKIRRTDLI